MKKDEMLKELAAKKTKLLDQIALLTQQVKDIEDQETKFKTDKNYFVRQSIRTTLLLNKTQLIIGNRKTSLNLQELLAAPYPKELASNLIKYYSLSGDIVLDCFMGSGTTGVAAKNLNRNFIGIELDETYFNLAKNRIESEVFNIDLFEGIA